MLRVYNAFLPFARLAARLLAPLRPKLRDGLAGRAGGLSRLEMLGRSHAGRVLWLHSASVGEYEQARPLAALVRERCPGVVVLHTFFSPSGYEYARRLGESEHCEYLPEDTASSAAAALASVQPRALVFLKFDLWPNLIAAAHRRQVPLLLLDATLQRLGARAGRARRCTGSLARSTCEAGRRPTRALSRSRPRASSIVSTATRASTKSWRAAWRASRAARSELWRRLVLHPRRRLDLGNDERSGSG